MPCTMNPLSPPTSRPPTSKLGPPSLQFSRQLLSPLLSLLAPHPTTTPKVSTEKIVREVRERMGVSFRTSAASRHQLFRHASRSSTRERRFFADACEPRCTLPQADDPRLQLIYVQSIRDSLPRVGSSAGREEYDARIDTIELHRAWQWATR